MNQLKLEKILIFLYIIPFAFDFKGTTTGGSVIQFMYLTVTLLSGSFLIYILYQLPVKYSMHKGVFNLSMLWWLYLFTSVISAVLNNVPLGNYIRVLMPFLLCGTSILITVLLYSRGRSLLILFKPLIYAVLLSVVWTPIYAIYILNISIDSMRYQIISPLLPILFAYGFSLFLLEKLTSFKMLTVFFIGFGIIALSITRSYFLIVAFVFLFLLVSLTKDALICTFDKLLKSIMPMSLFIISTIAFLSLIRPGFLDTWSQRLFKAKSQLDFDPTTLTRLAEYQSQMDLLFESFGSSIIGKGLGSSFSWSSMYFEQLSQIIPLWKLEQINVWTTGHSLWVYSLYSGGIIFGLLVPICIISSLYFSRKGIMFASSFFTKEDIEKTVFFSLITASIVGASFLANPLGERITGVFLGFGLVVPLLLVNQLQLNRVNYAK